MMGFGYGMGTGGWIAMTVFWVGLLTLMIWGASRAFGGSPAGNDGSRRPPTPEELLDRRYAIGELDDDTYSTMRATLASTRSLRR